MGIKLYYFDFAGRAEPIRLVLAGGKVEFEDVRVTRPEWPELKKKMPFGQVPVIEVDGTMIAQTGALLTFAAKKAGLYPEDPLEAALADQVVAHLEDVTALIRPTWFLQDQEAKIKARKEILAGPLKEKLNMICKLIDSQLSGAMDGFPTTILDDYPLLKDYRNHIASIDFVNYAASESTTYKPDA